MPPHNRGKRLHRGFNALGAPMPPLSAPGTVGDSDGAVVGSLADGGRGAAGPGCEYYEEENCHLNEGLLNRCDAESEASLGSHTSSVRARLRTGNRLLDPRKPLRAQIQRRGLNRLNSAYVRDLFSTLLHIPTWRFVVLFFAVYFTKYTVFASFYFFQQYEHEELQFEHEDTLAMPMHEVTHGLAHGEHNESGALPKMVLNHCILGTTQDGDPWDRFLQILWFTVQTSAGIGYGELRPDPRCHLTNAIVMIQTIVSALQDFAMLGVIWTRFSSALHRAKTIRFSSIMTMHRSEGAWVLSARVANVRKHQILKPCIRAVVSITSASGLATPNSSSTAGDADPEENVVLQELELQNCSACENRLWMGFPATVVHRVTSTSPLYGLSLADMEVEQVEIMVLVDGVDAMTSTSLQAQASYTAADVRMDERFSRMLYRDVSGRVGVDFRFFEDTWVVDTQDEDVQVVHSRSSLRVSASPEPGPNYTGTGTGKSTDVQGSPHTSMHGRGSLEVSRETVAAMKEAYAHAVAGSPSKKRGASLPHSPPTTLPNGPHHHALANGVENGGALDAHLPEEQEVDDNALYVAALEESVQRMQQVAAQALVHLEAATSEQSAFGAADEFLAYYEDTATRTHTQDAEHEDAHRRAH